MSSETRGVCGAECRDGSPCLNLAFKCPHHDESDRPADPEAVVSEWERDEPEDASASRPAGPTTRYRVRCPGCGYSDRFRSKGNAIRVQKHGCPDCGRGIGVSIVRADPDNQRLVTDGGKERKDLGHRTSGNRLDEMAVDVSSEVMTALLETINRRDEGEGAPLGEIIVEVAGEYNLHDTCAALSQAQRAARVYQPAQGRVRTIEDDGVDRGRGVETDGGTDTRRESEVTFYQAICTTCDTRMTPRRVKSRAKTDRKAHKEKDHTGLPHVRIIDFESAALGQKALERPDYDDILDDGGDA